MITVEQLTRVSEDALTQINTLVHQLSPRLPACSMELLSKIITNPNHELWVVKDADRIVGMATLAIVMLPEGERAQIEDVVVDEKYRGRGLGEKISSTLIEQARARNIATITLSSRADRIAANKLYQKLGFEQKTTNVYVLKL